jgi:SAM-dependent methyltransferase
MRKVIPVSRRSWWRLEDEGPSALLGSVQGRLARERRRFQGVRFDRHFGVDTCGVLGDLAALGAVGEHLTRGRRYEPIQIPVFRDIVRQLPISPPDYCFVDFGSGKGRALILAAEAGFKRIIGVEFSPVLHDVALDNIAKYRLARPLAGEIDVRCQDAATFPLPACDSVLFFYNPFDAHVMSEVIAVIERDWRDNPHDLIVAYRAPREASVLDAAAFLQPLHVAPGFRLYRTVGASPTSA